MSDIPKFLKDNIWVPIVGGVAIVAIVVVAIWACWFYRRRRGYERIVNRVGEHLYLERYNRQTAESEAASINCQFYLRAHASLKLVQHAGLIGTREQKHWFVVNVMNSGDLLMSMQPRPPNCVFPLSRSIRKTIKGLLTLIQHPYLQLTTDIDFMDEQGIIIVMQPLAVKGSLKDIVYGYNPLTPHNKKTLSRGRALPAKKIALYGRQIIEAIQFLRSKGLKYENLHSGNVLIIDGVARLGGYENVLMGLRSRLYPLLRALVKQDKKSLDVLCLGHVIYEMAVGRELPMAKPEVNELIGSCDVGVIEVLAHIFYHPENRVPTLDEVKSHPFFARVQMSELPELQAYVPPPIVFTPPMRQLVKAALSGKPLTTTSRRSSGVDTSLTAAPSTSVPSINGSDSTAATPQKGVTATATASVPPTPMSPPPAPSMPATPASTSPPPAAGAGRSALLSSIQQGKALRKVVTNDRSEPQL